MGLGMGNDMEIENMNMENFTIEQFKELVREQFEDNDLRPMLVIGKSGVGKTVSLHEVTKELGIGYREIRLCNMTETDLLGVPDIQNPNSEHSRTRYASNDLLPVASRDGECGILALDEITSATKNVRASAYQLLDNRHLGGYELPPKWMIVALGNGPDDGGVFQGMEFAFINKCYALRIEPDFLVWKKWAVKNDVHEAVVAYVSYKPDMLHKFDTLNDVPKAFPSPRSWEALSTKLKDREARSGSRLDDEKARLYAALCVGKEVSNEFAVFYSYSKKIVDPILILRGQGPTNLGNMDTESKYILASGIIKVLRQECNKANLDAVADAFTDEIDTNAPIVRMIGNVINWMYDISKGSLDLARMIATDLMNAHAAMGVVLQSSSFDEAYPKFTMFVSENAGIF